jgi:hypothetical protein
LVKPGVPIGGLEGNMDELPDATKDEGSAGE